MKILNLYAGIGGNRKMWREVSVTAIEAREDLCAAYKYNHPNDTVYMTDAHSYLLSFYRNFDFVWSSPPCPTHSQYRRNVGVLHKGFAPVYPDMKLYQEIIFLKTHFDGLWVVENVKPYYEPLIKPTAIIGRHYFWSNFPIEEVFVEPSKIRSKNKQRDFDFEFDLSLVRGDKRQVLRNCVSPQIGAHIMQQALITRERSVAAF